MTKLTDTRIKTTDDDGYRVVEFETTEGVVEITDVDGLAAVEVNFQPVEVSKGVRILSDVQDTLDDDDLRLALDILGEIDEDEMFDALEPAEVNIEPGTIPGHELPSGGRF